MGGFQSSVGASTAAAHLRTIEFTYPLRNRAQASSFGPNLSWITVCNTRYVSGLHGIAHQN